MKEIEYDINAIGNVGSVRKIIRRFQEDSLMFNCFDEPNKLYFNHVISEIGTAICEEYGLSPERACNLHDDMHIGDKASKLALSLYRWSCRLTC